MVEMNTDTEHAAAPGYRPRIKICGLTRLDDALAAAAAGADAIGLVFTGRSPRQVDPAQAAHIAAALPPFVTRVGLFMDPSADEVERVLDAVPLDMLQFHGNESANFCAGFRRPWIKALPSAGGNPPDFEAWPDASALLLDSHAEGGSGGTGRPLDWARLQPPAGPWILAGGLTPGNVAQACRLLKPPALDVSSGVEVAPGIKDHVRMRRFIARARHA